MATQKERNYEAHGRKAEIIGPTTRCIVFIDGASHPSFSKKFRSIRAARISFIRWADAISRCEVAA